MSDERATVERVRQVVAACGGWNRRSRGALLAWARAEGIGDAQLERLLAEALGARLPRPVDAAPAAQKPESVAGPERVASSRWWLGALASVGLAASALLVFRLAPRVDAARVTPKPVVTAPAPAANEPSRTLPPAPVSFPTPPEIQPAAVSAPVIEPQPLGIRPAGDLARTSVQAWRDAYAALARAWPTLTPAARDATLESLANWIATGSAADLAALRATQRQAAERMEGSDRMLAEALDAMLVARVASDQRISSAVAADAAFASAARVDATGALAAWAAAQVPRLVSDLGAPDARQRWAAWLQAVGAIASDRERVRIALTAIDRMLRGDARLDGQGIAADALGSLLAGVPARPDQSGFDAVRDAWVAWLRDARVPSARLWALGGIWRSRGEAPDAWLLPGERDTTQARAELAERWSRLATAQTAPRWKPLLAELGRAAPRSADARLEDRLDDLAARIRLVRRAQAPSVALDALAARTALPAVSPEPALEARWARQLSDPIAETRQLALRALRTEAPDALAVADASALVARAVGAQAREERALAQECVRGPLAETAAVREALAREVALCADPRVVVDFLQSLLGTDLPVEDANALRAAVLARLLQPSPGQGRASSVAIATRRLAEETCAWSGDSDARCDDDPAASVWALANRTCDEVLALHPSPAMRPLVSGLADRARRLARLAPDGPRGFAAALALLCDARAVRLAVHHASQTDALRRLAGGASAARAKAGDALQQAAISLDAIAAMHLLADGAPVPMPAIAPPEMEPANDASQANARLELDRAEVLLASQPIDRKRLLGALRHAVALDPQVAAEAALALAQASAEGDERARLREAAVLLGDGAAMPPVDAPDAADGIALAQLLAWSERGQTDRLVTSKLPERMRPAVARFASAAGSSVDDCLACLRQSGSDARARLSERLRAAALRALDPDSAGWIGSIAAGESGPLPEGDAAQPWRFTLSGG